MGKRKCVICGEYIDTSDDSIPYKNRYAHAKCFNIVLKHETIKQHESIKNKKKTSIKKDKTPKVELKNAMSEQEYAEKKAFYDKLRDIMHVDCLPKEVYPITENYIKKYGFTWSGMLNTLKYCCDFLESNNMDYFKLIPYYYDKAQSFYETLLQTSHENEQNRQPVTTITRTIQWKKREKVPDLIDIGQIGSE